jgi:hypothetical protein
VLQLSAARCTIPTGAAAQLEWHPDGRTVLPDPGLAGGGRVASRQPPLIVGWRGNEPPFDGGSAYARYDSSTAVTSGRANRRHVRRDRAARPTYWYTGGDEPIPGVPVFLTNRYR